MVQYILVFLYCNRKIIIILFCHFYNYFQDLEMENQNLRETLKEYHNEFAEVKNQGLNQFTIQ